MEMEHWFDYTSPWLTTAIMIVAAVVIGVSIQRVGFAVLRRVARFSVVASTVVEYAAAPAHLVIPLIAVQFVIAAAPPAMAFRITAAHGVAILLVGAITWLVMRIVAGVGEAVVKLHPASATDNLNARRVQTQTKVLTRTVEFFVMVVGGAVALMTLPGMRQVGASLLASAGLAGVVAGIAARPVFGNLIAGLQIALTQPIRLDDVVIIDNEWGRIEEITSTYVVVKIWDERRLVVPLQWIIQNPFQNWTRTGSQLLGTVFLWLDYRVPLGPLRTELEHICREAAEWDGRVALLQVTDASERAIQVRALVSAMDASRAWDLRCRVREGLIDFLQREHPQALPRMRAELNRPSQAAARVDSAASAKPGKGDSTAIRQPTHDQVTAARDARAPAELQHGRG